MPCSWVQRLCWNALLHHLQASKQACNSVAAAASCEASSSRASWSCLGVQLFTATLERARSSMASSRTLMKMVVMEAAVLLVVVMVFAPSFTVASDPDPLQDFCVAKGSADPNNNPSINGFPCKSVAETTAEDFKWDGIKYPADAASHPLGIIVTMGFADTFPGVNTMGISMHRVDFAKGGLNPPHHHARATEIIYLVEGEVEVGFVPSQTLMVYKTILKQGEVFVFPRGSLIFMRNIGPGPAWAISCLNTQYSPAQNFISALFASGLPLDLLAKNMGINEAQVSYIEKQVETRL